MHHVVTLIAERQKGKCTNRPLSRLLSVKCLVSKSSCKTTMELGVSLEVVSLFLRGRGKRTVVSIPNGPSALAVKEAAWGLARYAAISQDNGLVPIVEPEILLDGEHGIDTTFEVAKKVWAEDFFYLAENNVLFEGILLKPSMVTPEPIARKEPPLNKLLITLLSSSNKESHPRFQESWQVSTSLHVFFCPVGNLRWKLHLNAMNQSPNPWHVSFSYARALQNTCLKTWGGRPENVKAAQDALLVRASANSLAQLGKYTGEGESECWNYMYGFDKSTLLTEL
ncbi:putative fructose-bisphosphate aldolase [Helianthus anomalus]